MGPLLFNVFLNDIFLFLENHCTIYNYADDNTLSFHDRDPTRVKYVLENAAIASLDWFKNNFMEANPSKFQSIVLSRNQSTSLQFNIDGVTLKPSPCVKLLGVYLDNELKFDEHISNLCKKAAKQLNAMCRMSQVLTRDSMTNVFNSFIMSNFNYCSLVWHVCGKTNTRKMEKLHKRALRILFNDHDAVYSELLLKSNRSSLYLQRLKKLASFVFKVLQNEGKPVSQTFYEINQNPYHVRSGRNVKQPHVNYVKYGTDSLRYQGAVLWNSLPGHVKSTNEISKFKLGVDKWNGKTCKCGFCLSCTILCV